jgi:cytochrome P450
MDVIDDLASPLPVIVIAEMLGIPAEDCLQFKRWSDEVIGVVPPSIGNPQEEMRRYFL